LLVKQKSEFSDGTSGRRYKEFARSSGNEGYEKNAQSPYQ